MTRMFACGLCTCGLITASAALLAAPGQKYPGEPTRNNVWVQNQGKSEAVPVFIQNGEGDPPLRVQLIGLPTVTLSPATVVQTRVLRQTWEYKELTAPSDPSGIALLNAAGLDGWELVVSRGSAADGRWLLKRPH